MNVLGLALFLCGAGLFSVLLSRTTHPSENIVRPGDGFYIHTVFEKRLAIRKSPTAGYEGLVLLARGHTVTFAVGYGTNKTNYNDTAGLYARLVWHR